MNRLWVVESALSSTGAMADHRLALPAAGSAPWRWLSRRRWAAPGCRSRRPLARRPKRPMRAAELVRGARPGPRGQPRRRPGRRRPRSAAGGARPGARDQRGARQPRHDGHSARAGRRAARRAPPSSRRWPRAMRSGAVSTLFVLGGNPVYDAPGRSRVRRGARQGRRTSSISACASTRPPQLAHWHLPEAHFLEAWGDCRAADGTASVVQPLIAPLFGGHSAIELLALLAARPGGQPGYDAVRETWRALLPAATAPRPVSTNAFNRVLHDGLLADSASPPAASGAARSRCRPRPPAAARQRRRPGGLELVFRPSPAVHDGRFANIGWLQELPDAVTKLTWGNAALLAPATAERLGLENEDGARLDARRRARSSCRCGSCPDRPRTPSSCTSATGGAPPAGSATAWASTSIRCARSAALGFAAGVTVEPPASGTGSRRRRTTAPWRAARSCARRRSRSGATSRTSRAEMVEVPKSEPLWDRAQVRPGPAVGHGRSTSTPAPAATPAWSPARARTTCRWSATSRCAAAARCTGCASTATSRARRSAPEVVFQPVPCMQCENAPVRAGLPGGGDRARPTKA